MGNSQCAAVSASGSYSSAHDSESQLAPLNDGQRQLHKHAAFTKMAVWSRALPGKVALEAMRTGVSMLSLGLSEISRATGGNANHWFFVAKGESAAGGRPLFYVAQFGMGEIRLLRDSNINKNSSGDSKSFITEHLGTTVKQAADIGKALTAEDAAGHPVWIKHPHTAGQEYICDIWQSDQRQMAAEGEVRYFYFRKYGLNAYRVYACCWSEYEKNRGTYPAKLCNPISYVPGYYDHFDSNKWVESSLPEPHCTYCGDTYSYSYWSTTEWASQASAATSPTVASLGTFPWWHEASNVRDHEVECWTDLEQPLSLEELSAIVSVAPTASQPYSWDGNNCQHFANWMYFKGEHWSSRRRSAARDGDERYFYFRQYGANPYRVIPCTYAEYRENHRSYPAELQVSPPESIVRKIGGYYDDADNGKWVEISLPEPHCTYCGDTYSYSYWSTTEWAARAGPRPSAADLESFKWWDKQASW